MFRYLLVVYVNMEEQLIAILEPCCPRRSEVVMEMLNLIKNRMLFSLWSFLTAELVSCWTSRLTWVHIVNVFMLNGTFSCWTGVFRFYYLKVSHLWTNVKRPGWRHWVSSYCPQIPSEQQRWRKHYRAITPHTNYTESSETSKCYISRMNAEPYTRSKKAKSLHWEQYICWWLDHSAVD